MPVSDYTPSVDSVAALIPQRTRDENGNLCNTFMPASDGRTRPTEEQASAIILDAVQEAWPVFGDDIPDKPGDDERPDDEKMTLKNAAMTVVKYRAAALIELMYYSDQVGSGKSPYPFYQSSFESGLKSVGKAISEAGIGDAPGTSDDVAPVQWDFPVFPSQGPGMVGWGTNW